MRIQYSSPTISGPADLTFVIYSTVKMDYRFVPEDNISPQTRLRFVCLNKLLTSSTGFFIFVFQCNTTMEFKGMKTCEVQNATHRRNN